MRAISVLLSVLAFATRVFAQGQVYFSNYVPASGVIAPFTLSGWSQYPDGTGLGAWPGWKAQLFLTAGPGGSYLRTPIGDITTFRSSPPAAQAYLNAITVVVPGIDAGGAATFVVRIWNGSAYDGSLDFHESNPVTVTLGGGPGVPADLWGLEPLVYSPRPEPSTIALAALGGALLLFRRRRSRSG